MNLYEILKVKKGLPAENLHSLIFARKLAGNSEIFQEETVTGYPCILENSAGKSIINYKIYGSENGVGDLVENGENSGKYEIPVVCRGKNLFQLKETQFNNKGGTGTTYQYFELQSVCTISAKFLNDVRTTSQEYIGLTANGGNANNGHKWLIAGNTSYKHGDTVSITSDSKLRFVSLFKHSVEVIQFLRENCEIQLESGSEATEYEPYHEPVKTSIFVNKPLKTGEILKYPENSSLPKIPTFEGTTIIETTTEIPPSDMEITYKTRGKNL